MNGRSFLDSNILVYTDDHDRPEKQARALDVVQQCRLSGTGVVSTQVLQEYFVTATRKLGVPAQIAREKVEIFSHFEVVVIQVDDILSAIDLHRLHSVSLWDGLIVRAALAGGCSSLLSEDMQPGRRFDGLEVLDPFA
jgi:predicted nucleic acid-binding protein